MAGGIVIGPGEPTVFVEGSPCAVETDKVKPHGDPPHASAIFPPSSGNPTIRVGGKPIIRETSLATCQHPLTNGAATVKTS